MTQLLKNPLLRLFIVYIIGIFAAEKVTLFADINLLLLLIIGLFSLYLILIFTIFKKHNLRWCSGSFALLFFLFFGFFNYWYNAPKKEYKEKEVCENGVVTNIKNSNSGWSQITFEPLKNNKKPSKEKWLINLKYDLVQNIEENCIYSIKGKLSPLTSEKTITSFDYNKYLYNNGYSGQMYISNSASIKFIYKSDKFLLTQLPKKVNQFCAQIFSTSGLNPVSTSIVKALLLGDRTEIDKDINQQFIKSGVVHILAVSGLHVGIIYMIINSILSLFFSDKSHFKWIIAVIMLVSYAFIAGFSPSVSRAVLMFSIVQIGQALHNQLNTYQLVVLSAFILLIIQPFFIFNAGFWLSHMAVIGIVAFFPIFFNMLNFKFTIWNSVWTIICVSTAAQLGTMPFSFYVFGTFPTYFLLANILILPVVTPLLVFSFLLLVFSFSPFLTAMVSGVINDLIYFMISVTKWINTLQYSYLDLIWVSLLLMLSLYLLLYSVYKTYIMPTAKNISMALFSVLIVLGIYNFQFFSKINNNSLVVYDFRQGFMIDIFHKGSVITIESDSIPENTKSSHRNNLVKELMIKQDTTLKLSQGIPQIFKINFNNQKYFIVYGFNEKQRPTIKEENINTLFISGNKNNDFIETINLSPTSVVIAPVDMSFKEHLKIQTASKGANYSLYSLRNEGTKIISK